MGFEFNQDDTVHTYANPYRFENFFLAIGAAAALAGGISAVFRARELFSTHEDKVAITVVAVAMLALGLAIKLLVQALSQMRFYLGRKFPLGLAGELAVTDQGVGEGADTILKRFTTEQSSSPSPEAPSRACSVP